MPNMITQVSGWFAGQTGGSAFSSTTGSIWNGVSMWANYQVPTGIVPYPTIVSMAVTRFIPRSVFEQSGRMVGMTGDYFDGANYQHSAWRQTFADYIGQTGLSDNAHINDVAIWSGKPVPSIPETLFLFNRQLISESLAWHYLNINTQGELGTMQAWLQSRFEIPGPSDLIHFAVRDSFDPSIVRAFGYHKELPIDIIPWMEKQGYGGNIGIDIPPGATTTRGEERRRNAQWFDLYWWSHWQLVSPTQAAEMLHRMYLVSPYGPAPGINENNQFTIANYRLLLKAADYPQFWRDKLEFISYSPLTRVDVRRMYDLEVVNENEVYHAYRAIGYDDNNAQHLVRFTDRLRVEKRLAPIRVKMTAEIREMYMWRLLDSGQARDQLIALRIHNDTAIALVRLWDLQWQKKRLQDNIKIIRTGRFKGNFSNELAERSLLNLGLPIAATREYTTLWTRDLEARRKLLSATQNQTHYISGIITRNVFRFQLTNLNFRPDQIDQMIAYADQVRLSYQVKFREKQAKIAAQQAARNLRNLLAPYTESNIKAMFKQGVLGLREIYQIFRLKEWGIPAIVDWISTYLDEAFTEENANEYEEEEESEEEGQEEEGQTTIP